MQKEHAAQVVPGKKLKHPIKLWIVGEGRYQPTNMPTFQINASSVVWDYGTNSSNLALLREQGFTGTANTGWLVESSIDINTYTFGPLTDAAQFDPIGSGYGDDAIGTNASMNAASDIAALVGSMQNGMILTRVDAELSRAALANDLALGASADQSYVSPQIYPGSTINAPVCPPPPQCGYGSGGAGGNYDSPRVTNGCAVGGGTGMPAIALLGIALVAGARRRRSRPQVTTTRNNDRRA